MTTNPRPACRSTSPDGHPCTKTRGHRKRLHYSRHAPAEWDGGVRTPATWERPDDGYMSEADYQSWGRL